MHFLRSNWSGCFIVLLKKSKFTYYQVWGPLLPLPANLVLGTDLLFIKERARSNLFTSRSRDTYRSLTASSWYNVIFHLKAYQSWRWQGEWAAVKLFYLTGQLCSHSRASTSFLSPWSLKVRFILCSLQFYVSLEYLQCPCLTALIENIVWV